MHLTDIPEDIALTLATKHGKLVDALGKLLAAFEADTQRERTAENTYWASWATAESGSAAKTTAANLALSAGGRREGTANAYDALRALLSREDLI